MKLELHVTFDADSLPPTFEGDLAAIATATFTKCSRIECHVVTTNTKHRVNFTMESEEGDHTKEYAKLLPPITEAAIQGVDTTASFPSIAMVTRCPDCATLACAQHNALC